MRLDELELYVDMNDYDEVYVVIKTHPSITQNKYTREERLKEWVTEGSYKMHAWPSALSRRECRIEKIENDAPKNSFLRIIVRMEDEEKQTYLSDILNLNPSGPVVIVDGRKPDEKPILFQGLEPTSELMDKYGDCAVDGFKIEDHEFEDEYGYATIRPTMFITVTRGGLNTYTEKKPDTRTEENPEPVLYLSTLLKLLPEKLEVALDIDEIDDQIESEADDSIIMKRYGNQVVENVFPINDRLIISITHKAE